jgi:hypothetical protein
MATDETGVTTAVIILFLFVMVWRPVFSQQQAARMHPGV